MTPGALSCWPLGLEWWAAVLLATALIALFVGRWWVKLAGASMAIASILVSTPETPTDPDLMLIDVGQGESIMLRDGNRTLLIDGGGWSQADIAQSILIPTLTRWGVARLDAVVLTHPDLDHCGGLLALASYLSIDNLYTSVGWQGNDCASSLLSRAGIDAHPLWRGERLALGRWQIEVLHPGAGARLGRNDRSLVLRASVLDRQVLLTGDLETAGEGQILGTFDPEHLGPVDVLKVGHHGSRTSTSIAWLERLRPRLALISCGGWNRYGHPAGQTLERLADVGARVLRTDIHGAIRLRFSADGGMHIELPGLPRKR